VQREQRGTSSGVVQLGRAGQQRRLQAMPAAPGREPAAGPAPAGQRSATCPAHWIGRFSVPQSLAGLRWRLVPAGWQWGRLKPTGLRRRPLPPDRGLREDFPRSGRTDPPLPALGAGAVHGHRTGRRQRRANVDPRPPVTRRPTQRWSIRASSTGLPSGVTSARQHAAVVPNSIHLLPVLHIPQRRGWAVVRPNPAQPGD
jgi:hypothetical protein